MIRKTRIMYGLVLATMSCSVFPGSVLAAVSAEEAKQLGGSILTPWGAEKAGNKEGTIPAYAPMPIKAPAGWNPKVPGNRPNPFKEEKPLFTITAQNYMQYADKLDGMVAMFKKYPNYRMDIYPTHRTMIYPKYVIDNTLKNATSCKTIDSDGYRLAGDVCYGGLPFPIPKTGAEAMWNKLNNYRGVAEEFKSSQWIVPISGNPVNTNYTLGWQKYPMFDPKNTKPAPANALFWQLRLDYLGPARQVGEKLVLLDPLDPITVGRRAYSYIPGQRRVKLAPDLAYDTPTPVGGGGSTMDDGAVFIGALDRYDWKLVGKKEKFIPYNNFAVTDPAVCPFDKYLTRNFPNPDCVRWELHRVWAIHATLRKGFRHIYPVRDFFWDEDAPGIGVAENYDAAGSLYRMVFSQGYPLFQEESDTFIDQSASAAVDLQRGTWFISGGTGAPGLGYFPSQPQPDVFFSPEALAGEGVR
jgi:Protein of unknown function (DUF1329)